MEFFGYEKCDKLIWTSGEGNKITNKISKQGSPKTHIKKIYSASTLGFGFPPQKYTCDILSEAFISSRIQAHFCLKLALY